MTTEIIEEIEEVQEPTSPCCCKGEEYIDGIRYWVTDAGCKLHGIKSRWTERLKEGK